MIFMARAEGSSGSATLHALIFWEPNILCSKVPNHPEQSWTQSDLSVLDKMGIIFYSSKKSKEKVLFVSSRINRIETLKQNKYTCLL